jgi:hypothetical protein
MVYITGQTSSAGYPVTPGAFDTSYNGGSDAVVSKLSPDIGGVMHIADITMGYIFFGNRYRLGAVTTVVDARGIPVPGALVTGIVYFPDGQQVVSGGLTNFRGQAFAKNVVELLGTYTFTVIDITKPGSTYDPSQNVETSDSITIP